ncbi:protein NETWORKED 3A-like [Senna tora]|uniref:Protein NETWORKED 3A-like n=1 Tax=Senna tora TaxID=362788 RepID=A0A834WN86_9FABA|nr:protein NETWORKED 3A-like [Senna tora]
MVWQQHQQNGVAAPVTTWQNYPFMSLVVGIDQKGSLSNDEERTQRSKLKFRHISKAHMKCSNVSASSVVAVLERTPATSLLIFSSLNNWDKEKYMDAGTRRHIRSIAELLVINKSKSKTEEERIMSTRKDEPWWLHNNCTSKRSSWLQSTIVELNEKTNAILKLIEEDADSFIFLCRLLRNHHRRSSSTSTVSTASPSTGQVRAPPPAKLEEIAFLGSHSEFQIQVESKR